ncbi:MAG: pyrimidine dimer DNA glycosylase/endonuclease V [Gammaproteobacteria bacterium]|nr:pyrimidine dimer DNA glycosylase/endonuclease V [Gammaproteobacteria bacterium]MBU1413991.1 pyrimidine dimer DNA glycosylase/endonuclease V [Gammaproteobacteria bacterium]
MRIWTLHPKYLDARGLVALWREALLAQAVLSGQTRGYTKHPQLIRFKAAPDPAAAIASYLEVVHAEATQRGYRFDAGKIAPRRHEDRIATPRGQLDYEWEHLKAKLRVRAPEVLERLKGIERPTPHPLFRIVPGGVAEWEVVAVDRKVTKMTGGSG